MFLKNVFMLTEMTVIVNHRLNASHDGGLTPPMSQMSPLDTFSLISSCRLSHLQLPPLCTLVFTSEMPYFSSFVQLVKLGMAVSTTLVGGTPWVGSQCDEAG